MPAQENVKAESRRHASLAREVFIAESLPRSSACGETAHARCRVTALTTSSTVTDEVSTVWSASA